MNRATDANPRDIPPLPRWADLPMFSTVMHLIRSFLLVALLLSSATHLRAEDPVTIFAAASLNSALGELLPRARHPDVHLSFASSSTLAKQIEAGAPADIYLSANGQWMDYLHQRALIDSTTRVNLLGNKLVFIATTDRSVKIDVQSSFSLSDAFEGRIALGDPSHVPAGIYARQALRRLGWWNHLSDRLAPSADVRSALNYVARGECDIGIVYATDAIVLEEVQIIAPLPDSLHAPIRYPAAIVAGRGRPAVRRIFAQIRSDSAQALFSRHGFTSLQEETPRAQP